MEFQGKQFFYQFNAVKTNIGSDGLLTMYVIYYTKPLLVTVLPKELKHQYAQLTALEGSLSIAESESLLKLTKC